MCDHKVTGIMHMTQRLRPASPFLRASSVSHLHVIGSHSWTVTSLRLSQSDSLLSASGAGICRCSRRQSQHPAYPVESWWPATDMQLTGKERRGKFRAKKRPKAARLKGNRKQVLVQSLWRCPVSYVFPLGKFERFATKTTS